MIARFGCSGLALALLFAAAPLAMAQAPAVPPTAAPRAPGTATLARIADQLEKSADTVVAEVNGAPITTGMVADRLRAMPPTLSALPTAVVYRAALEDLVEQRALAVKARELGLDKDPATVRRIAAATDQELGRALLRKITPELVTDAAIGRLYDATVAGKPGPEEVRFRVIAAPSEAEANDLLRELGNGADFAVLAQRSSKDPSAGEGGEIGYARRDLLTPEIGAVAFALSPGQRTAFPVLSNGVWFIIEVEGRRQQAAPTLESARNRLSAELSRQASREIYAKARASVAVKDYGPTGMGAADSGSAAKNR